MATNNEIKPSLKEKIYQDTLDEFARKQWNPESLKNDFKNWKELVEIYPKKNRGWLIYQADIEKAVKLAIDKTELEVSSAVKQTPETPQEIDYCEHCGHKIRREWIHAITIHRLSECGVKLQHYDCECNEAKPKINTR